MERIVADFETALNSRSEAEAKSLLRKLIEEGIDISIECIPSRNLNPLPVHPSPYNEDPYRVQRGDPRYPDYRQYPNYPPTALPAERPITEIYSIQGRGPPVQPYQQGIYAQQPLYYQPTAPIYPPVAPRPPMPISQSQIPVSRQLPTPIPSDSLVRQLKGQLVSMGVPPAQAMKAARNSSSIEEAQEYLRKLA